MCRASLRRGLVCTKQARLARFGRGLHNICKAAVGTGGLCTKCAALTYSGRRLHKIRSAPTTLAGIAQNKEEYKNMNRLTYSLKNTELDGLTDSIVRAFKADAKAALDQFIAKVMEEIEKLSGAITTAILQDKTASNLEAADGVRDEALRTLGTVLSGYAALPVEAKKAAAAPLKAVWDKYSKAGILNASYTSESSLVESLLEELGAESLAENRAALDGVAEAISAVRDAQTNFALENDAYVKALNNKAAAASSYKKPLLALINDKLVPYLNAMQIAGNENCADFAKSVETEIARINDAVAKRGKK
ncbi:hypothetical protein TRSA_08540 [Treponema saccharophilum]|uniref:Uncharacterized protein n=2 Tax=Treponema saccharophilum TaxID=165 RepID=H7EP32_9SPIR|nr:hypothetical protein TresaDRAFT_0138 [Treponema saccharophilum DSM 2985]BDC95755.1 hypothetical protein TRSA_08540 [Treponema saccharophilum]